MTIIDLQAARVRRARAACEGVRRIGANTEMIEAGYYTTCACGHAIQGPRLVYRNKEGFIGLCPNCLDKECKGELSKGDTMSDTGVNDDEMPFKLTAVVRAKTPEAIGEALAALHGLARDKHMTLAKGTPIVRGDFSISIDFGAAAPPPGKADDE